MIHELTLAVIDSETDFYFLYMKVISYTHCDIFSESRHQKRRLQTEQLPEEEVKRSKEESSLQCRRILCVRVHISYQAAILDLVNVEDWGEEIFAEGVGVKLKK